MNFDPITRLLSREAVRFVGTVGEVVTDALSVFSRICLEFKKKEVRTQDELSKLVQDFCKCKEPAARVTLDVAGAMGLIQLLPGAAQAKRKYALDEHGRVVLAMFSHSAWIHDETKALVFVRPMFEANGDYLLQVMEAINQGGDRDKTLDSFRRLVREMADAKYQEIQDVKNGARWQAYVDEVSARRRSILGVNVEGAGPLKLSDVQELRKRQEQARRDALTKRVPYRSQQASSAGEGQGDAETKTLDHHFSRSKAWLVGLAFVELVGRDSLKLTQRGERWLSYMKSVAPVTPLRIPPSFATLDDCFRMPSELAKQLYGYVVDDSFWENGLRATVAAGEYIPSEDEIVDRFAEAFASVRVPSISEASLMPLREVLFLRWLFDGKPPKSELVEQIVVGKQSVPSRHPSLYGFGRNRQGRLAYLFRKSDAT